MSEVFYSSAACLAPTDAKRPQPRRGWRGIGAMMVLFLLAGCVAPGAGGGRTGGTGTAPASSFVGGDIRVVPPAGYCVDPAASHDSGRSAVILIGECGRGAAVVPAVISITVGEAGSSEVLKSGGRALSDYFTSPTGRAALARDGAAASVVIRSTALSGGAMMMNMYDRQVGEYWRAVLGLKGRLVSVSVMAPQTSSLSPAQSRALLEQSMTALRASNGSAIRKAAAAP